MVMRTASVTATHMELKEDELESCIILIPKINILQKFMYINHNKLFHNLLNVKYNNDFI